jgi:hypothetical protein
MVALPVLLAFKEKWLIAAILLIGYWLLFQRRSFLNQFRKIFPQTNRIVWLVIFVGLVAAAFVNLTPSLRGALVFVWVLFALTLILPIAASISKMR